MTPISKQTVFAILMALALLSSVSACSDQQRKSVEQFSQEFQSGVDVDITPLASPAQAVEISPLIVRGTLREVVSGVKIVTGNSKMNELNLTDHNFTTFVVDVTKVVSGDERLVVDGRVYLNNFSGQSTAATLEKIRPNADILAVAYFLPKEPMFESTFERTDSLPSGVPLLGSYLDGTWLQGSGDTKMYSLHGDTDDLAPAWDDAKTIVEYEAKLSSVK